MLLGLKRAPTPRPPVAAELGAVTETVRASLDEVRQVARRLRPGVLDDLGLVSALDALAADVAEASGVPVTVEVDGCPGWELTPSWSSTGSLRRPDERGPACRAQAWTCRCARGRGRGGAGVTDDGRGIGARGGRGARGMRERALLVTRS